MKETDLRSVHLLQIYIYRLRSFSSACLQGDEGHVTPEPFHHGTPLRSLLVRRYKYKSHLSEQPHDPSITRSMGQIEGIRQCFWVSARQHKPHFLPGHFHALWVTMLLVKGQMMSLSCSPIGHRLGNLAVHGNLD